MSYIVSTPPGAAWKDQVHHRCEGPTLREAINNMSAEEMREALLLLSCVGPEIDHRLRWALDYGCSTPKLEGGR